MLVEITVLGCDSDTPYAVVLCLDLANADSNQKTAKNKRQFKVTYKGVGTFLGEVELNVVVLQDYIEVDYLELVWTLRKARMLSGNEIVLMKARNVSLQRNSKMLDRFTTLGFTVVPMQSDCNTDVPLEGFKCSAY